MSVRRDEIIEVAKAMFAQQGVSQTTVRQIGARAGILSGSLYHHFSSKYDIVDAILNGFCEQGLIGYREMMSDDLDCCVLLQKMTYFALSLVAENPAAVTILLNDSLELVEQKRFGYLVKYNREIEEHWIRVLRAGVDTGKFRSNLDVALHYRFIRDAILGTIRWYDPSGPGAMEAVAEAFLQLIVRGISA